MKKYILLISALLASDFLYAEDLIIAKDETYTITDSQRELHLKKFMIGDDAVIQFAEGVSYWDVSADEVEVGVNVVIDGRGKDGIVGMTVQSYSARAEECQKGAAGSNGSTGATGANGVDIQMKLTVNKLGSLKINVSGGRGGVGSNGANGQQGGLAVNCDPTDGGNGGNGGQGGNGGNGGKLIVSLSSKTQSQSLMAMSHLIEATADAGRGAAGGQPGMAGDGSEGKFINQKTLTGDKKWVSGGKKGEKGVSGEKGSDGHEGRIFIGGGELNVTAIPQPIEPVAVAKPVLPVFEQGKQLDDLKEQLQVLEKRIEALEKAKQ